MTSENPIDFLIVGQGLAGSIVTNEIAKRNYSFKIVDDNYAHSASMAAGGIMHPMSFKRLIESWKSIEFINFATNYYRALQNELGDIFFEAFHLKRPFISLEEQNDWMSKMKQDEYVSWMGISPNEVKGVDQPFGLGEVFPSGKINVEKFLHLMKGRFEEHLDSHRFDFEELIILKEGVTYQGENYRKVIFCEGYQYINNPFFGYLPNNITKGEILEIQSSELDREMISRGCFIAPNDAPNMFTVGSTYEWNNQEESITVKGRKELEEKLQKAGVSNYTVIDQKCGIRPTTHDRRPLLGNHPTLNQLYIFNGMGSKTVMMAPLLAEQLINHTEGLRSIFEEANITRLEKRYFNKFTDHEGAKV